VGQQKGRTPAFSLLPLPAPTHLLGTCLLLKHYHPALPSTARFYHGHAFCRASASPRAHRLSPSPPGTRAPACPCATDGVCRRHGQEEAHVVPPAYNNHRDLSGTLTCPSFSGAP